MLATNFSIDLDGLLVDQILVAMVLFCLLIDETHHTELVQIQVPFTHLDHGIVLLVQSLQLVQNLMRLVLLPTSLIT